MLQQAQPGIALIAAKSGATVVPVGIVGTYNMMPPGRKFPRPAKLVLAFGRPLCFPPDAPRQQILDDTMAAIACLLQQNGWPEALPAAADSPSPQT